VGWWGGVQDSPQRNPRCDPAIPRSANDGGDASKVVLYEVRKSSLFEMCGQFAPRFALRRVYTSTPAQTRTPLTRTDLREGHVQVREDPLVVIEVDDEVGGLQQEGVLASKRAWRGRGRIRQSGSQRG
jgi:hypothetical protein